MGWITRAAFGGGLSLQAIERGHLCVQRVELGHKDRIREFTLVQSRALIWPHSIRIHSTLPAAFTRGVSLSPLWVAVHFRYHRKLVVQ